MSDDRHTHVVSEKNQAKEPADLFLLPVRDCLHCSVIASAAGAYDVTALFLPLLAAFFQSFLLLVVVLVLVGSVAPFFPLLPNHSKSGRVMCVWFW